jgi:hypothetical protein
MKMGDYMVFECEVERTDSDGSLMSLEDEGGVGDMWSARDLGMSSQIPALLIWN